VSVRLPHDGVWTEAVTKLSSQSSQSSLSLRPPSFHAQLIVGYTWSASGSYALLPCCPAAPAALHYYCSPQIIFHSSGELSFPSLVTFSIGLGAVQHCPSRAPPPCKSLLPLPTPSPTISKARALRATTRRETSRAAPTSRVVGVLDVCLAVSHSDHWWQHPSRPEYNSFPVWYFVLGVDFARQSSNHRRKFRNS
jgi:hypothetical protein